MHQAVETLGPCIGRYPGYNGGFHLVFASISIHLFPLVRYTMRGLRVGWIFHSWFGTSEKTGLQLRIHMEAQKGTKKVRLQLLIKNQTLSSVTNS